MLIFVYGCSKIRSLKWTFYFVKEEFYGFRFTKTRTFVRNSNDKDSISLWSTNMQVRCAICVYGPSYPDSRFDGPHSFPKSRTLLRVASSLSLTCFRSMESKNLSPNSVQQLVCCSNKSLHLCLLSSPTLTWKCLIAVEKKLCSLVASQVIPRWSW